MIRDGQVKNQDLANDAVTSNKIKNGEVKAEDIADGVIPDGGGGAIQLNVHSVTSELKVVEGNSLGVQTVDCPVGEVLTGGGFTSGTGVRAEALAPQDENTWSVTVVNELASSNGFRAIAFCLDPTVP